MDTVEGSLDLAFLGVPGFALKRNGVLLFVVRRFAHVPDHVEESGEVLRQLGLGGERGLE